MNLIIPFLGTSVLSVLNLFLGFLLGKIAEEELNDYNQNFLHVVTIIIVSNFFIILYFLKINVYLTSLA
ncbi:hypothetical protein BVX95_00945, partial [archaeon D22]